MAGCAAAQASAPPTTPTAGQGIPLLTHTPCYSAATAASHRSRTGEPSYSSPRGLPLLRLPRLRVVPFLGLAVVQTTALVLSARRGQSGQGTTSIGRGLYMERLTAGSTTATRKCLLITCKIIIPPPDSMDPLDGPPVFCEKKSFPPDYWDPPDGPLYFAKKTFAPHCWDPPATSSHARKCVRAKKNDSPP